MWLDWMMVQSNNGENDRASFVSQKKDIAMVAEKQPRVEIFH